MNAITLRLALISLAVLLAAAGSLWARDAVDQNAFSTTDKAFYLNELDAAFIRPGLELTIIDVTIPADRQPEVWFKITDPGGLPLDRDGIFTPGPVSTSFILSYIPAEEASYVAYTTRVQTSPITNDSAVQATSDSGGAYTPMGDGEYVYKFATVLPEDFDADATHTLGIYARRDLREFDLDRYVSNELEHFVPSGSADPQPRDIVTTETCNGRCHDPLAIHGGARQEVGLCILCHNPTQGIDPDTGSSVDFPVMVHKIHAGAHLANGYTVIGYRQSVHDYSEVEYPAPLNDCESCHTGGTPTADFPLVATPAKAESCNLRGRGSTTFTWENTSPVQIRKDSVDGKAVGGGKEGSRTTNPWIKDGQKFFVVDRATGDPIQELTMNTTVFGCVGEAPGSFRGEPGTDHTNWLTRPSRVTCGSCHDDVNFATGEGHSELEFVQEDDSQCALCHEADSGNEFDRSIRGAHTVDYQSDQLPGVLLQVHKVTHTGPGQRPRVTFWLSDKNGLKDPAELNRLRFSISGPNEDFDYYIQEEALAALEPTGKKWTYTFEAPIPDDASGSFTLGVEGRVTGVVINAGQSSEFSMTDQMQNYVVPLAVTDAEATPRREIVSDTKCESCHTNLSIHGGNRHEPQYCATCHYPEATDEEVRSEDNLPAQSIHFKYMVHKIHRGAELENGYVVLGYRGSVNDFGHVEYPGDLRNCDACHVNDSQQLPLPDGLLATPTPYDFLETMQPATSACLSCHDGFDAAAHADANTGDLGESCAACHGTGKEFAVDKVHAR